MYRESGSKFNQISLMIDIHVHLADSQSISPGFITGIAESMGGNGSMGVKEISKCFNLYLKDRKGARLCSQMQKCGVKKSVLLIADYGVALGEPQLAYEQIHEHHAQIVSESEGLLTFFAGFDPRRGKKGLEVVKYWTGQSECSGVKLYPPCGFELDDEGLHDLWGYCSEHGVPVLTHTGPSLQQLRTERNYPESLEKTVSTYSGLKIILAHAPVWDLSRTVGLLEKYPDALFADISSFQNLDNERLQNMLNVCFERVPDQVVFGSDAPLYDFSSKLHTEIERVKDFLPLQHQEKLFTANAGRLLDL